MEEEKKRKNAAYWKRMGDDVDTIEENVKPCKETEEEWLRRKDDDRCGCCYLISWEPIKDKDDKY